MSKTTFTIIVLVFAVPAFFLARTIWPFPNEVDGTVKTFFAVVTAIESLFTGIGIAFVILVLKKYLVALNRKGILGWLTFVSIAWILISGYPHDNSHIAHGADLHGLIPIEIIFHGTLAIAALITMVYFLRTLRWER